MVAAGSLVAPNTTVPTGEIWAGNPAKKLRDLDAEEAEFIMQSAVSYSALARIHAAENAKTPEEIEVRTLQELFTNSMQMSDTMLGWNVPYILPRHIVG